MKVEGGRGVEKKDILSIMPLFLITSKELILSFAFTYAHKKYW